MLKKYLWNFWMKIINLLWLRLEKLIFTMHARMMLFQSDSRSYQYARLLRDRKSKQFWTEMAHCKGFEHAFKYSMLCSSNGYKRYFQCFHDCVSACIISGLETFSTPQNFFFQISYFFFFQIGFQRNSGNFLSPAIKTY